MLVKSYGARIEQGYLSIASKSKQINLIFSFRNKKGEMGSLSVVDYVIFALMLAVCGAIGIYHAIRGKQQQTTDNFLMANRSMGKFPIAMSLLVSFLSAIAILGIPSEVYTYGLSYVLISVAMTIVVATSAFLYVPVFYKLKITSTNEVINFGILFFRTPVLMLM